MEPSALTRSAICSFQAVFGARASCKRSRASSASWNLRMNSPRSMPGPIPVSSMLAFHSFAGGSGCTAAASRISAFHRSRDLRSSAATQRCNSSAHPSSAWRREMAESSHNWSIWFANLSAVFCCFLSQRESCWRISRSVCRCSGMRACVPMIRWIVPRTPETSPK